MDAPGERAAAGRARGRRHRRLVRAVHRGRVVTHRSSLAAVGRLGAARQVAAARLAAPMRVTMNATAAMMSAAPAMVAGAIASPRKTVPRNTATTGLTYAYVETRDTGAFCSSQVYAEYASSEPKSTR